MDHLTERNLRNHSTRMRDIEDRLEDVVRLETYGGNRIEPSLLKITGLHPDSPTSGVRMYYGNLHAIGTLAAATTIGVTVRIPEIAPDILTPSYGGWGGLPACCGVLTRETWIGATETHTEDRVYCAVGLLLLV
jgi:hypothetical protein